MAPIADQILVETPPSRPNVRKRPSRTQASGGTARSPSLLSNSEPPSKKRYVPGGPGGGGRYVLSDGTEEPVGGTGPGGYNYVGPRGRIGRENMEKGIQPVVYQRRERSARTRTVRPRSAEQPPMHFASAAQAAAAVVQNDGYKPREERGWEEFHPTLDIDAKLMLFSSNDVDGISDTRPVTPSAQSGPSSLTGLNGTHTPKGETKLESSGENTPPGSLDGDRIKAPSALSAPSAPSTPTSKRRPGRPPRDPVTFYANREAAAARAPKTPKIASLHNQHAKERLNLPQPTFTRVDPFAKFEDKASGQARYVDRSMANVGYQETDIFIRDNRRLIKASYAIEDDLDKGLNPKADGGGVGRVEYDMDEQDDCWLEAYNADRKSQNIPPITREIFEITITKIEVAWYSLEKRIPKPNPKPPQTHRPRSSSAAAVNGEPQAGEEQDSKCAICDDGDCENTNAIVFCDGCDLAVHQECYGVPFIPEGQWLCRKCLLIGRGVPTCIFCPNTDGGFKQANSSKWAHLLCAMWIPEVSLGNPNFMEPVQDVDKIPKNRWKLACYICQQKMGACIQCGNKNCFQAFHVTCARRARLYLKMKNSHGVLAELDPNTQLKAFCDKHCPTDYAKQNEVTKATREAQRFYKKTMKGRLWASSQESALAMAASHQHHVAEHRADESQIAGRVPGLVNVKRKGDQPAKQIWMLPSGAPVIPWVIYNEVEASLQRFTLSKRRDWVTIACRYWTLKRESRRGAPLIKRLQVQSESFSSMEVTRRNFIAMGPTGKERLLRRLSIIKGLEKDLEKIKVLSAKSVERSADRVAASEREVEEMEREIFPVARLLPPVLEKAFVLDIKQCFTASFNQIQKKLDAKYYVRATSFARSLGHAFMTGIANSTAENEQDEQGSPSKQATLNLKECRKLAKRIIKAIQPLLQAAIRVEAELLRQPAEKLILDVEALLEASLDPLAPNLPSFDDPVDEDEAHIAMIANRVQVTHSTIKVSDQTLFHNDNETAGIAPATAPMDIDLLEDTVIEDVEQPDANTVVSRDIEAAENHSPETEVGNDVDHSDATASVPLITENAENPAIDTEMVEFYGEILSALEPIATTNGTKSSDTPPDTTDYTAPQEYVQPSPLTPPVSNGGPNSTNGNDQSNVEVGTFAADGAGTDYVPSFQPKRTLLIEQINGGEDTEGSEDLSDMDDEELKGLGLSAEMGDFGAVGTDALDSEEVPVISKPKILKSKARKRRRMW